MNVGRAFRNLTLFWKVLIPFLALLLIVGTAGAFLIVRDLSSRARTALNQELLRESLDARTVVHDRELYVLESANLAANLQGMAQAVREGDAAASVRLLRSVFALKTDLHVLATVGPGGSTIGGFARSQPGGEVGASPAIPEVANELVQGALRTGEKGSGLVDVTGMPMLVIVSPVCSGAGACLPVGAVIVGMELRDVAAGASGRSDAPSNSRPGIGIYGADGRLLARSGIAPVRATGSSGDALVRSSQQTRGREFATLYAPLHIQGKPAGTLGVSIESEVAFASVRSAGLRLALILLAAMIGIFVIGAVLSRLILAQVRPLVETARTLGDGGLWARAPVLGTDELGELATRVNQMADQLQAGYETLESRVEQRTKEIQRLLRERTDFFAAISHEFRTPLAVILRQAEVLADPSYPKSSRWGAEAARVLDDAGQQLLRLINTILDLSKAEAGHTELRFEEVRLPEIVRDLQPTIDGLAKGSGLGVDVSIPDDLPPVRADPARLREIVLNLVDNAVKYTPQGGNIGVTAAARNGHVKVSVSDDGVGIPKKVGDRVFEPFYRVEGVTPERGRASTGLGLALAKRLVKAHGGNITYASRPGRGTTFTFTLVPAKARRWRRK